MLFIPLILLFPAVSLASWLPIKPRQASNADNCTITSTLPAITLTSIYPTSTVGGHGQVTGGGSLIYTTAFPTLGPDGAGLHTYTITVPCAETQCQRPASADCPPGFTTTTVVCRACGKQPITTILTLPIESATAAQGSAGGDSREGVSTSAGKANNGHVVSSGVTLTAFVTSTSRKTLVPGNAEPTGSSSHPENPSPWKSPQGPESPNGPEHSQASAGSGSSNTKQRNPAHSQQSDTYTAIHRNPGSPGSPEPFKSPADNAPQSMTADSAHSTSTEAVAEAGSESTTPTYPSGQVTPAYPTAIVVTGHASGNKITGATLVQVVAFAVIVLYPFYA